LLITLVAASPVTLTISTGGLASGNSFKNEGTVEAANATTLSIQLSSNVTNTNVMEALDIRRDRCAWSWALPRAVPPTSQRG
jgi:hypothetical protein